MINMILTDDFGNIRTYDFHKEFADTTSMGEAMSEWWLAQVAIDENGQAEFIGEVAAEHGLNQRTLAATLIEVGHPSKKVIVNINNDFRSVIGVHVWPDVSENPEDAPLELLTD